MLNFNLLRVFFEAVRCGGITKAAEQLCITQPAASNSIRKLQDDLGISLFRKQGRGVRLTAEGEVLYKKVKEIFELENDIESIITGNLNGSSGHLNVGLASVYARFMVSDFIRFFSKEYSAFKLSFKSGNSKEMLSLVRNQKIPIAIAAKVSVETGLNFTPFRKEKIVAICSPKILDTSCLGKPLSLEELVQFPIIMKDEGSAIYDSISKAFFEAGVHPSSVVAELANLDAVHDLVKSGSGIAFVPEISVLPGRSDINIIPVEYKELSFQTYCITHTDSILLPITQKFKEAVIETFGAN